MARVFAAAILVIVPVFSKLQQGKDFVKTQTFLLVFECWKLTFDISILIRHMPAANTLSIASVTSLAFGRRADEWVPPVRSARDVEEGYTWDPMARGERA